MKELMKSNEGTNELYLTAYDEGLPQAELIGLVKLFDIYVLIDAIFYLPRQCQILHTL